MTVNSYAQPTTRLANPYKGIRCDCGAPASYRVAVTMVSANGWAMHEYLDLCSSCYQLFCLVEHVNGECQAQDAIREGGQ